MLVKSNTQKMVVQECEDSVFILVFKFLKVASFSCNDSLTSDVRHSIIAFTRTLCCDGLPKVMF